MSKMHTGERAGSSSRETAVATSDLGRKGGRGGESLHRVDGRDSEEVRKPLQGVAKLVEIQKSRATKRGEGKGRE